MGLPCGVGTGGQLFTIDVKASGSAAVNDIGTITITSVIVRDCSNTPLAGIPGAPADIPIDEEGPAVVSDLSATQLKSGNDGDGTTKVTLTFTPPGDAALVEVYRAPLLEDGQHECLSRVQRYAGASAPAIPSYPPSAPWTPTAVTTSGQADEPADRGFWYYVAFSKDDCGNVSAVSNMTGGTLNYHLGDVSDGVNTPESGDNLSAPPTSANLETATGSASPTKIP